MVIWHGEYVLPSNIIIKSINFYDLINQLMIIGIDNYHVFFSV